MPEGLENHKVGREGCSSVIIALWPPCYPSGRPLPRSHPLPSRHLGMTRAALTADWTLTNSRAPSPLLPCPSSQQPREVGKGCFPHSVSDRPAGGRLQWPRHPPPTPPLLQVCPSVLHPSGCLAAAEGRDRPASGSTCLGSQELTH